MLKKISNSLSTDNSIPIFGYSINEADIASASFFCVVIALYKAESWTNSTPLLQISLIVQSGGLSPPFPVSVPSNFWDAVQKGLSRVQKAWFCIRDEQFGRRRGQNPTIRTREDQCEERRGQKPTICTRAISFSGSQQAQTRCNLTCFHDVYWAVITMMGKPNSGMDRGELRSTLSRAGSCRSSANNINEERRGQKGRICTRGLRRSGSSNVARMQRQEHADNCR